ncbi:MAG TPA: hypothetical protein DCL54_06700 [Alphaproteobacteria bacterium]|nr:hypothetical protein [Alphaproteobacteria bacterium]
MTGHNATRPWRAEFWTLLVLILVTRVADGTITYLITPDLAREINPFQSVLGWGWVGLIAGAAVILAGVMTLNYISLVYPIDNFPSKKGLSFEAFRGQYFSMADGSVFSKRPWHVMAYVCGYVFPRGIIVWSVLVVGHNYLVYSDAEWYRPLRLYRITFLLYLVLPILALSFIWVLQRKDYQRYLRQV